jgi:two-component system KDP operon response regulator KdpE
LRSENPNVILLDLKMPGLGGLETCRLIRERSEVPIIIVSGSPSERDRVETLEEGADDYITKPAGIDEMVARIHAAARRPSLGLRAPSLQLGTTEINLETRYVKRGEQTDHLTAKEFQVLHYMLLHQGQVISHRRLLQAAWGPDYGEEVQYLRVFINQLRKKIEPDPAHPRHILTELSSGYRFVQDNAVTKP